MSELISGKEAFNAWFDGVPVEVQYNGEDWFDLSFPTYGIDVFKSKDCEFRLKPSTITLNGVEVPAPFEPKDGEKCFVIDTEQDDCFYEFTFYENSGAHKKYIHLGAWRTEEEIKQVVEALRSIFNGGSWEIVE